MNEYVFEGRLPQGDRFDPAGERLHEARHEGDRSKLDEMENKDEVLRGLRAGLAQAAEGYLNSARSLSRKRSEAARKLEKLVEAEINDLAMKASFRIAVEESEAEEHWTASGIILVVIFALFSAGLILMERYKLM